MNSEKTYCCRFIRIFSTTKSVIALTVPQYLLLSLLTTFAFSILISRSIPDLNIVFLAAIAFGLPVCGLNSLNQIIDLPIDSMTKPHRPLPSGKITANFALTISLLCYGFSIISALLIVLETKNMLFLILLGIDIIVTFSYTLPRIYLKGVFPLSMIIGTVLNFAMMFFSAWIIWGKGDFPYHYFYLFASAGLIIANTKDFEDVEGDKKYNIKTLPVILGIHNSIRVMIIAMMAITVYVLALYLSDTVMTAFTPLVVILNLLYMIYLVYVDKKQVSILHGAYVTQSSIVNISMLYYLLMIYLFIL